VPPAAPASPAVQLATMQRPNIGRRPHPTPIQQLPLIQPGSTSHHQLPDSPWQRLQAVAKRIAATVAGAFSSAAQPAGSEGPTAKWGDLTGSLQVDARHPHHHYHRQQRQQGVLASFDRQCGEDAAAGHAAAGRLPPFWLSVPPQAKESVAGGPAVPLSFLEA
jgi:hypothetical protein